MKVHPKTGHECATLKPWSERNSWTPPEELVVRVRRGMGCEVDADADTRLRCSSNTPGCWIDHWQENQTWYAYIKGTKEGEPDWLTHGYSMSHALEMAQDLVQMMYEECKGGGGHCYCRDVTWGDMFSSRAPDDVARGKKCCLCNEECRVTEFEP